MLDAAGTNILDLFEIGKGKANRATEIIFVGDYSGQVIDGTPGESDLNGHQWIVSLVGHGLEIAGDSAIGIGVLAGAEASGDFLLDLAHSQVALRAIVGECDVRIPGEQQYGALVLLHPFPQVVGVRLGDPATLTLLTHGDRRKLAFSPE